MLILLYVVQIHLLVIQLNNLSNLNDIYIYFQIMNKIVLIMVDDSHEIPHLNRQSPIISVQFQLQVQKRKR
jgi:hypothetical protein